MKFILSSLALAALARASFPITGTTVNCRSAPSTEASIIREYKKGDEVTITCQTDGPNINGNSIWDKTSDGCYVSDYFVKTDSVQYVTDKCSDTSSSGIVAPTSSTSRSTSTIIVINTTGTISTFTTSPTAVNSTSISGTGSMTTTAGAPTSTTSVPAAAAGLDVFSKSHWLALSLLLVALL